MANEDTAPTGLSTSLDTEVGKVVVDMGLATRTEIEFCREQQKQSSDPNQRSLANLLVDHQFITSNQAKRIRKSLEERKSSQIPGYQLISKLGKGAMATVYKARQMSLDRIVAVKVLPKKLSDNPEFVDRFYKEGKAAARLSHNNIVQAIDVGCAPEGYHYFVMEYVEGLTLYDIMQPPPVGEGRNFAEAEALDVTIQIADALAHAHLRNLIARDVKAKNRDDRYQSTEDMLVDLQAVRRGEPPTHARRAVHLDGLEKLEETGKTVDIAPAPVLASLSWTSPLVVAALGVAGASLLANLILLMLYLKK